MEITQKIYSVGIDIGSTTAKVVVLNEKRERIYGKYRRHYADIKSTVLDMLREAGEITGEICCAFAITGSGGMKLAENLNLLFVQEVIAVTSAVRTVVEDADAVVELGGEDAKIIFLTNGVEQRMNGVCAGGTGAFIDQMAALLQTDASGLNDYAKNYKEIYPIAARCGVFAKSDIQPLINDGTPREDLAASIFQAVVNQTISGLACGRRIKGKVVFLGGPLYFLSELRRAFADALHLDENHAVFPDDAHLFAAHGAALKGWSREKTYTVTEILGRLSAVSVSQEEIHGLEPLFEGESDYKRFVERQAEHQLERDVLEEYEGACYLGLDAGSTTMKIVLISEEGKLLYSWYGSNQGAPLEVARRELVNLYGAMNHRTYIARACATGYGENLLKSAFHMDEGEVETIAHYYAAKYFEPDADCILDIGGQDMKCIHIKNGCVDTITLNEACSSGCGSFIEQFANSLGCTAQEFAQMAVKAENPVDLGTRCTVFMNSNVKQAQKEGAKVEDIAAGLAYSVIKNALFKVIKVTDPSKLGEKIVVQGGTFYNDAVLRCFEIVSGREAIRPDIAGVMGAFGAALIAKERCVSAGAEKSGLLLPEALGHFTYDTKVINCKGCQNHCRETVNLFPDGQRHISGNRCERGMDHGKKEASAPNMFAYKRKRIFEYEDLSENEGFRGTIGIPRALNIYENFPFWAVFFRKLGFRILLSPFSDSRMLTLGMDSIPSESACYPAKLAHGHIEWLISHGAKTIFYPCIYYERKEDQSSQNHYNCPMVTSYPENIRNNVENLKEKNIRYLDPFLAFSNEEVLGNGLADFMGKAFKISKKEVLEAVREGWREFTDYRKDVEREGRRVLEWMEEHQAKGIVLAGRPYHLDPGINHGIPEMIQNFGFAVLTEDSVSSLYNTKVKLRATNQWTYHARLYAAAGYVSTRKDLELIQLNSFGCGLDAVTIDQVQELMEQSGKMYTLLKIDEVNNLGAARIRVRSMMAAMKMREGKTRTCLPVLKDYERKEYTQEMQDAGYTILCTGMIQPHFDFFEAALRCSGYRLVMMRSEDQDVLDLGLKYVNNDACYPTFIVTGQILAEIFSGKYDTDKLAVMMVQTGGGCRASNYVGFIRKALKAAGYPQIPVISINANGMEKNSGMHYTVKMGFKVLQSLIYGDILMKVVHRMRPYELIPGSADVLYDKWHDFCISELLKDKINMRGFYRNCRDMIKEFDSLPVLDMGTKPKVGIVGEVLVKYMPLANNHLAGTLEKEGAEAVIPDFVEFLEYCFWNSIYRNEKLGGGKAAALLAKVVIGVLDHSRTKVKKMLRISRNFEPAPPLKKIRLLAQEVLQLGNQCGEGWFLAGEVIDLIKQGADNIVCVQPFGCLPNHVVGKGIMKKVKELYPNANIVAVDYDPSASKVNQINRIKLMMEVAREKTELCCIPEGE